MAAAALAFLAVAALCWDTAAAALPRLEHPAKSDDGSLSLLVVGDWGRKGTHNQSRVAEQVKRHPTSIPLLITLHILPRLGSVLRPAIESVCFSFPCLDPCQFSLVFSASCIEFKSRRRLQLRRMMRLFLVFCVRPNGQPGTKPK
jgi:hypothetical protein